MTTFGGVFYALFAVAFAAAAGVATLMQWNKKHKKETPQPSAEIHQTVDISD